MQSYESVTFLLIIHAVRRIKPDNIFWSSYVLINSLILGFQDLDILCRRI